MKIVVVGGHLTPALAVIEKLSDWDIYYVGRKHSLASDKAISLEYETMARKGIPFVPITMGKFQRTKESLLKEIVKIPIGIVQSLIFLSRIKPNIILSFGSYVSIPVAFAGSILGIPIVIHEQTQDAGLANRIEAILARKICISFESSRKYFPKNKTIFTGNPIRDSIINSKETEVSEFKEELPLIFVTGGSQGSHKLNKMIFESIPDLLEAGNMIHQTGDSKFNDFEKLTLKQSELGKFSDRYKVVKFLTPEEFGGVLSAATLTISRAGANTVNEILHLEKPAFLIPLSFAQKEEQLKNALLLRDAGLAEVANEEIDATEFKKQILYMLARIKKYQVKKNIEEKNSASLILNVLKNAANKN